MNSSRCRIQWVARDRRAKILYDLVWIRSLNPSSFFEGVGLGWGWQGAASRRDRDHWVLASLAHVTNKQPLTALTTGSHLYLGDVTLRLFPGYQVTTTIIFKTLRLFTAIDIN